MTEPEPRPESAGIVERIRAQSEDDPDIVAAFNTGQDASNEYYIVVTTKQHDGREYVNIRYFCAAIEPAESEVGDTWMQNGINMRRGDDNLTREVAKALIAVSQGTDPDVSPVVKDLTE
jgi:hypothetical protein